ncbi:MAG: hypothetical protein IT384_10105 [Deltaproteobacteria bacterium]|nr:hypothetical protein [Deltaproteobacteria bacterium]
MWELGPFRAALAAIWIASSACRMADATVLVPDLPEEVAWLAVWAEDGAGQIVDRASSGLARRPPEGGTLISLPSALPPEAARLRVVGYNDEVREGQLDADDDERSLRRHPVRLAGALDPVLPGQRFVGSGALGSDPIEVAAEETAVELTADWLPPCPALPQSADLRVDAHCFLRPCQVEISRSGCLLDINAASCTLGHLPFEIDGRSRLHFADQGASDCTEVPPQVVRGTTAAASLRCLAPTECDLDLYVAPFRPLLEASASAVLTVPPLEPSQDPDSIGYLSGLVAWDDDQLALIAHEDFRPNSGSCDPDQRDRLVFLDAVSGVEVGSSSIAGCATKLMKLAGGGALVVHGGARPALSHLDAAGRTVGSGRIDEPRVMRWRVRGVAELASRGLVAVLFGAYSQGSAVLTFDRATLAPALRPWTWPLRSSDGTSTFLNDGLFTVTALEDLDQLVVTADSGDRLLYLDPERPGVVTATTSVVPGLFSPGSGAFRQVAVIPEGRDLLIASVEEIPALLRRSSVARGAMFFEEKLQPTAFQILDRDLAIAAFTSATPPFSAFLAVVDLQRPAVLPGAISLGPGLVKEMAIARDGTVWATLPASGQVVRIRMLP